MFFLHFWLGCPKLRFASVFFFLPPSRKKFNFVFERRSLLQRLKPNSFGGVLGEKKTWLNSREKSFFVFFLENTEEGKSVYFSWLPRRSSLTSILQRLYHYSQRKFAVILQLWSKMLQWLVLLFLVLQ